MANQLDQKTGLLYDLEQRAELSKIFAASLYYGLRGVHSKLMSKVMQSINDSAQKFPWFQYRGNRYGVLKHMEEAQVYGVFDFLPEKRSALYVRAVFNERFCAFAKQPGLSKEGFVRGLMNPKSEARKPTKELELGKVSSVGRARTRIERI